MTSRPPVPGVDLVPTSLVQDKMSESGNARAQSARNDIHGLIDSDDNNDDDDDDD